MNIIKIESLNKSFSDKHVIKNLNLVIPYGKAVCIMGDSGCGKTTLINILLGFESADSGTVTGVPTDISVVFQEDRLCEDFSALSNVRMVAKNSHTDALATLTALGLGDVINKPVKKLSGGMKRRVAIARALTSNSDLIIMDEPFKGLDESTKESVMLCVKNKLQGKTLLLVTHDRYEAEFMDAVIYRMTNGKIE